MGRVASLLLLTLFLAFPLHAGTLFPYLVKDLTPSTRNERLILSSAWRWTKGDAIFYHTRGVAGGLWRTDGTAIGTFRLYNGQQGRYTFSYVPPPVEMNGLLYYPVETTDGTFLYRTDGTMPGTSEILRIPRWLGGALCGDGKLSFGVEGGQIGITDGTAAGTSFYGSAPGQKLSAASSMTTWGTRVFFNGYHPEYGRCIGVETPFIGGKLVCGELWTTDGTAAGTYMVADTIPGPAPGGPENLFVASNGKLLYFAASCPDFIDRACPWVSDGTTEGTRLLGFYPSIWDAGPYFSEYRGRVYFSSSNGELYQTDGTSAGTVGLREMLPFRSGAIVGRFGTIRDRMILYVYYYDQPELWSFDGTTAVKIGEVSASAGFVGQMGPAEPIYYTQGYDFFDPLIALWSTDGTAAGTKKHMLLPRPNGTWGPLGASSSRLLLATGQGNVFMTDGTELHEIDLNIAVGASSLALRVTTPIGNRMYFESQGKIGATDGTAAGTSFIFDDNILGGMYEQDGRAYFYSSGEWWTTDGTRTGTKRVRQWLGAPAFVLTMPAFIGDKAIFAAGDTPPDYFLMRRDGDGTVERLGPAGYFSDVTSIPGAAVLWHRLGGATELMVTDGTKDGTKVLATGLTPRGRIVRAGARAFFGASKNGSQALTLWTADVSEARMVKEFSTLLFEDIHPVLAWRDLLIFTTGVIGGYGGVLWRSDGTAEGTFRLSEEWFDDAIVDGDQLTLIRFTKPGYEVWTSDGTAAGTVRRDVYAAGWKGAAPFALPSGGVAVSYTPTNFTSLHTPGEIHIRNTRTKEVSTVNVSSLQWALGAGVGGRLYFPASRQSTGWELWAVSLDGSAPVESGFVSIDYRGTAATASGRAAIFRVRMTTRGATRPSVIASTVDGTMKAQRDYVPFTREIVFENDNEVILEIPLRNPDMAGTVSIVLSSPVNAVIENGFATATILPNRRRSARH